MDNFLNGLILKSNSGFYYVKTESGIIECRARGIFRRKKISPLVGDRVLISLYGDSGTIEEILPRKNSLIRPQAANLDILFIVVSASQPEPNMLMTDRMTVSADKNGIEPVVLVTKNDIRDGAGIAAVYKKAMINSFKVSAVTGEGIGTLKSLIKGHVSAFTGNSGVGKSTLLNRLDPFLCVNTGEISKKLGRGRHTTRLIELFETCGGFIADTPGFSSLDTVKFEPILKEDLQYAFREFKPYINGCRFTGCSHTKEKGCALLEALNDGKIAPSRHKSYCEMYEEAKGLKEWELKKRDA